MISLSKDGIEVPLTWKAEHFEIVEEVPVPKKQRKVQVTLENIKVGDMVAMWSPEENDVNYYIPTYEKNNNLKLIDTFYKVTEIDDLPFWSVILENEMQFWGDRFYKMEDIPDEEPIIGKKIQVTRENVKVGDMVAMWNPEENSVNNDIPHYEQKQDIKLIDTFYKVEKVYTYGIAVNGRTFMFSRFYKLEDEQPKDSKKITPEKIEKVKQYISTPSKKEHIHWALVNKITKEVVLVVNTRKVARSFKDKYTTVKKVKVTIL